MPNRPAPAPPMQGQGDIAVPPDHAAEGVALRAERMQESLRATLEGRFEWEDPRDAHLGGAHNSFPQARLDEVYRALSLCWPHNKVQSIFAEKWGTTPRVIRAYIERVYDNLRDDNKRNLANKRNRLSLIVEAHYAECMAGAREKIDGKPTNQRPALLNAAGADLDRLAKLHGCYVEKVEVTGADGAALQVDANVRLDLSSLEDKDLDDLERITTKLGAVPIALLAAGKR